MATRIFPRFKPFTRLYFECPLAPSKIILSLIGCCYYHGFFFHNTDTQWKQISQEVKIFLPAALVST